jgi:hypothetical protein
MGEPRQGLHQVVRCRIAELRDPHIAKVARQRLRPHRVHVHFAPLQREHDRFRLVLAAHGQPHRRAGHATHAADRLLEALRRDRITVDGQHDVPGAHAGQRRRRTLDRRHHHHSTV